MSLGTSGNSEVAIAGIDLLNPCQLKESDNDFQNSDFQVKIRGSR